MPTFPPPLHHNGIGSVNSIVIRKTGNTNRVYTRYVTTHDYIEKAGSMSDHSLLCPAGMNVDTARGLLNESGLPITPAADFGDAAQKVVASLR